jgi:hypothetical protein
LQSHRSQCSLVEATAVSSSMQLTSCARFDTMPPPPPKQGAPTASRPPVQAARKPRELEPIVAFYIFAAANIVAAFFAPIQDCDEVFNYWEPTHYLNHGYGLQTWEYSPEYAIRSWTYTGLHSLVIKLGMMPLRLFRSAKSKEAEFYFLRTVLAITCAACQTRFYSVIARTFNPRVALFFVFAMVFSPGMYHAAPAYLPSSFAMYTSMLGFSAFMDWSGGLRTAQGLMWFGIGALLGWPFAAALVLPFVAEEVFLAAVTGQGVECIQRLADGFTRSVVFLVRLTLLISKASLTLCRQFRRRSIRSSTNQSLLSHGTLSCTMFSAEETEALISTELNPGTFTSAISPSISTSGSSWHWQRCRWSSLSISL